MLKKLIKWLKSCFEGSAAVSSKSKAGYDVKMADLAREKPWLERTA